MAIAALVLYGIWLLLAFGLRTVIQYRRTGSSGFHGIAGRPGSVEWFAGMLFAFALLTGVAAPVAELTDILGQSALATGAVTAVGLAIAVVGVLATLFAQLAMGDSWRIGVDQTERTELVTEGPFRVVRNPIYAAMLVTSLGLALMVPNVVALAGAVGLAVAVELHVRLIEEPYLRKVHGDRYRRYSAAVGRFAPRVGRMRGAQ